MKGALVDGARTPSVGGRGSVNKVPYELLCLPACLQELKKAARRKALFGGAAVVVSALAAALGRSASPGDQGGAGAANGAKEAAAPGGRGLPAGQGGNDRQKPGAGDDCMICVTWPCGMLTKI